MKKFLSFLIACIMVFSAVGIVAAEDGDPDPEPEFVRPVEIEAVDENGDPIDGVELQLKDADGNVMETWTANGERTLLLSEGDYTLEGLSAPEGYLAGETANVVVERSEEEQRVYIGHWKPEYHDHICTNKKHVGLEMFWLDGDDGDIVAYCFNHGLRNPSRDEAAPTKYKEYTATEELLSKYALNKADGIESKDLYNHVMAILWHSKEIGATYHLDEVEVRYVTYMAIKNFTDPKKFPQYDDNGNDLLIRDANGKPIKDENGNYQYNAGGTVLGAIVNHAKGEGGLKPEFINAYNYLIGCTDYPADYHLYFYYPEGFNIENDNSYQILISAKRVPTQEVKVVIHPSETFTATLKWNDRSNRDKLRPTPEKLLPKLHLYLGGEEITAQYPNCMTVTDNGDNTYTVKIVNLSDEDLTLKIDSIFGYKASKSSMQDGGTITLTHSVLEKLDPIKPMPPVKPITPPWGGSK